MRWLTLIAASLLCASCASRPQAARESVVPPQDVPAAAETTRDFQTGMRVYNLHCARCHGKDGKDKSYPFIATLDGIGKRMSLEEILQATWATGFVSERQFTEEEERGLALYVATL